MNFSACTDINRILTIIDACQVDAVIHFAHYLPDEFFDFTNPANTKGLSISKYIDRNFNFHLVQENKPEMIKDMAEAFVDGDLYHYAFYIGTKKIGEGFDSCEINSLDPSYFKLTKEHLISLGDVEVYYSDKFSTPDW